MVAILIMLSCVGFPCFLVSLSILHSCSLRSHCSIKCVGTDRRMDKEGMVHIYNGILLSHKKEWNNAICSNMDGPRDCHTEWSKSEKDKYMISLICGILKKCYKWTYLQNRNRVTDVRKKLMVTRGEWRVGGINWEIRIDIYTVLYIK